MTDIAPTAPSLVKITTLSQTSSRAEIEEALGHCNRSAKRCTTRDNLGRVNAEWVKLHRFIDYLLGMWLTARPLEVPDYLPEQRGQAS